MNGEPVMTMGELRTEIVRLLTDAGCDSPEFEALCLLEDIGKAGRGQAEIKRNSEVSPDIRDAVINAARCRAAGEPLQYLLGNWDFLNLTLSVGRGVLIPRPETELLCTTVADRLNSREGSFQVLDLCAGTGCVGLGIASLCHRVYVRELELSDSAFVYLTANLQSYPQLSVTAEKADILTDFDRYQEPVDVLVSNPPYITAADIKSLQREVTHEPAMALNGGEDGCLFYRAIAEHWIPKVKSGGFVAVEIGMGESAVVCDLFRKAGLVNVFCLKDCAGNNRVVIGDQP